mgnify:FL=1
MHLKNYTNMSSYKYIAAALALAVFTSCSDKQPEPSGDAHEVTFSTSVTLNTKANLIKDLADGQVMNAYVKSHSSIDAADLVSNAKATNKGGTWHFDPTVKIVQDQNAFIFAAYPYNAAATDPKAIPVDVTTQQDVLYSGTIVPASYNTCHVSLNMKHALSMVAVNVKLDGYAGQGLLTGITLEGDGIIATKGTMNVSTGYITPTAYGRLAVTGLNATCTSAGVTGALPAIWAIPFSSKERNDITMTVTIDGKEYKAVLPEVTMHTGWQYVFRAVLTANGLVFVPDGVEEYALNKADDQMGELGGYGLLKFDFTGSEFAFPIFEGDNVFGNILSSGGQKANFSIGGSLKGLSGKQTITVETWNSTGFEIRSFEGIDAIDMSQY